MSSLSFAVFSGYSPVLGLVIHASPFSFSHARSVSDEQGQSGQEAHAVWSRRSACRANWEAATATSETKTTAIGAWREVLGVQRPTGGTGGVVCETGRDGCSPSSSSWQAGRVGPAPWSETRCLTLSCDGCIIELCEVVLQSFPICIKM